MSGDLEVVLDEWLRLVIAVLPGESVICTRGRQNGKTAAQLSLIAKALNAGADPALIRELIKVDALSPATPARGNDDPGP